MKKIYDALSVAIDSIDREYYEDAAEFLPIESNEISRCYFINEEDLVEMKSEAKKTSNIAKIVAVAAAFICVAAVSVFLIMNNNKVQVLDDLSSGSYESSTNISESNASISGNNSYDYVTVQNAYNMENIPNTEDFDTSQMLVNKINVEKLYSFSTEVAPILSQKEIIENFRNRVKENVGENYNEDELQVMSVKDAKTGEFIGESRAPLSLYEEQIISGEYKYVLLFYEQMDKYDENNKLITQYYGNNTLMTGDVIAELKGKGRDLYKQLSGDYSGTGGIVAVVSLPEKKRIFLGESGNEALSEKIIFSDKAVTVEEMIKSVEKNIYENIVYGACDFDYKVSGFTITDAGNGKECASFSIAPYFEGLPLLAYGNRGRTVAHENDPSLRGEGIEYYMGEIGYVSSDSHDAFNFMNYGKVTEKTEIKGIIDLNTALNKVYKEKAPELKLDIYSANLKYARTSELNYFPVWQIVCVNKQQKDSVYVYLVDAETGETCMSIYNFLEYFK